MTESDIAELWKALNALDAGLSVGFCVQSDTSAGLGIYRRGLYHAACHLAGMAYPEPASPKSLPALRRTRLGRPRPIIDRRLTNILGHKPLAADLHVSYTHDGGAHITALAHNAGICGLGIDLVHLPRLAKPRHTQEYLHRFAASFMSDEELGAFRSSAAEDDVDALRVRVAKHFSLMEAASKALGTGLRLGAGYGTRGGVRPHIISVMSLEPCHIEIAHGGSRRYSDQIHGHVVCNGPYVAALTVLRK
jgi:hypothetical protein